MFSKTINQNTTQTQNIMKEYQLIFEYLKSKGEINEDIINDVIDKFCVISKSKKGTLVEKGQVCDKLFFLTQGLVRNYFIDINGFEYTRLIIYKNKFFTNFLSFQKQIPSRETIECLENSNLLAITKNNFEALISKHPQLFRIFTFEVIDYHNFHLEKLEFLSLLTPKEKLEYLWENEKELIKRVSNAVLASYMSIKQETCSRLKKEIFK